MWANKLIGGIGDQVSHIVWAQLSSSPFSIDNIALSNFEIYRVYFDTQLYPWFSSQPLMFTLLSFFLSLFGPNFYNIFLLITLGLNFYFSHRLFKRFKYSWFYILVFNFSSYIWTHFGEHIELSQVWIYCLLFELLLASVWLKSPFKFSLWLVLFSLISNYIGFFSLVYFGVYAVLYGLFHKRDVPLSKSFTSIITVVGFYILFLGMSIYPYIQANYIQTTNLNETSSKSMQRNIDEYITFSSRPWYFLIPSTKNPLFGELAKDVYNNISNTGNYLTDDYFVYEHSSNYFGWSFLIFLSWLLFRAIRMDFKDKTVVRILLVSAVVTFILMLPPVVTLKGVDFYNVNFILFKLAPFFRVTSRMSVILHLSLLVSVGYIANNLKLKSIYFYIIGALILIETYIPLRVGNLIVPQVYTYISDAFISNERLVVYPYSKTLDAFLWLPVHKQLIVNPRGYITSDFSSEEFTLNLYKDSSLLHSKLTDLNVKYIVNFDSSTYSTMNQVGFKVVASFEDSVLYEVIK